MKLFGTMNAGRSRGAASASAASAAACAIAAMAFSACSNPLLKDVKEIRSDAVSPRIAVSLSDSTALASGTTVNCGQISSGTSAGIVLGIRNDGESALDIGNIGIAMAADTEAGTYAIAAAPSARLAAGAVSSMTISFTPLSAGTKTASVSIPTNDTRNQVFSFTVSGIGSSVAISTNPIISVTTVSAVSGGNITGDGGDPITARGICWSGAKYPTTSDAASPDGGDGGTGSFSASLAGLTAGTLYYVRAYAINASGTTYGPQVSFTTLPEAPEAPAIAAVDYASGSGKVLAAWKAVKGAAYYELYYSASDSFPSSQTPISATGTSATVGGLADFATNYFWLKACNASGASSASPPGAGAAGVRVTEISLAPSSATISIGATRQLSASIAPAAATYPAVTWSSSAAAVATVSESGLVTAVGPGTATVAATSTATAAGNVSRTAACAVSVPPAAPALNAAVAAFGGEVSLSWSTVTGATSYNVYYSLSSGAGTSGTKVSGGAGTSITVSGLTNWSAYCFAVTAVGTGGESVVSNQLSCMPIRQEIIVVNKGADSIDFNLFNAASGSVSRPSGHEYIRGPNMAATDGAASVAVDPEARNALYVAYTGTGVAINPGFATYSFSASGGYATSPYSDHHCDRYGPEHLVVVTTPSGKKSLYVAFNAEAYLVMYDIDASGNLSSIHTYANPRNDSARYLSADPSGKFLFASNYDASRITSYAIDSATGHLTEAGYVASGGSNPYRSAVTPDGSYLLVTNYGSGTVASFAINPDTGVLTQTSSIVTMGEGPTGIAIDAAGANAYICSARNRTNPTLQSGYLNRFTLSGGALSPVSDWAQTLFGPLDIALDITGTKAIVLNSATSSGGSTPQARIYPVDAATGVVSGYVYSTAFDTGATPNHLIVVKLP